MRSSLLVPIVMLLAAASPAHAQIYKWVDESGKTHYSDKPPGRATKFNAVEDRISVYTPAPPMQRAEPAHSTAALSDRVDELERQLRAERLARQQVELAALAQAQAAQAAYVPYPVPVAVPILAPHRNKVFRPRAARGIGSVVGPGIMPGTFNGPDAVIAGNVTLRTGIPAFRGRGAAAF